MLYDDNNTNTEASKVNKSANRNTGVFMILNSSYEIFHYLYYSFRDQFELFRL